MIKAVLTFSLPEDKQSDIFTLYKASTEDGEYAEEAVLPYRYGETSKVIEDIDEAEWYKVQISNSVTDYTTPLSDPIFGGDFATRTSPFLAISTTYDGANYASTSEVYAISGLTTDEVSVVETQKILRATRAYVDVRLDEIGMQSFRLRYNPDISRRKYNGHFRVVREVEIYLAISTIMNKLANESQLALARQDDSRLEDEGSLVNISIGGTSLNISPDNIENRIITRTAIFSELATKYAQSAMALFSSIMPNTLDVYYKRYGNTRQGTRRGALIEPVSYTYAINDYIINEG
jgi:hypothetical protein